MAVVLPRNLSTDNVTFAPLNLLKSGLKQGYVNYNGGKFLLQTPPLTLGFNMSVFDKVTPAKYSVDLSLRGYDEPGSKTQEIYNVLHTLDEFMIDQGVKNSKAWFKDTLDRKMVAKFYSHIIKWSKDNEGNVKKDKSGVPYPPNIRAALRKNFQNPDVFEVKMFNGQKVEYPGGAPTKELLEGLLVRGSVVRCILKCTGLWVSGSKFGISWKADQIVVDHVPENVQGYALVEDEEAPVDDDDVFGDVAPSKSSAVAAVLPEETEDDAPEDSEPIPVPKKVVPTAAVKKRTVVAPKK